VQGLLPYRDFDEFDIVANLLGMMLGLSSAIFGDWAYRQLLRRRKRSAIEYEPVVGGGICDDDTNREGSIEMV